MRSLAPRGCSARQGRRRRVAALGQVLILGLPPLCPGRVQCRAVGHQGATADVRLVRGGHRVHDGSAAVDRGGAPHDHARPTRSAHGKDRILLNASG